MHVNCYCLISFYVFQAISKLNMDNNYSAILQERRNILHLNNLYVLRRCMQVAILFKILTCQPTWYIREVYFGLPERPEIVRLNTFISISGTLSNKGAFSIASWTTCQHTRPNKSRSTRILADLVLSTFGKLVIFSEFICIFCRPMWRELALLQYIFNFIYLVIVIYLDIVKLSR